MATIKVTAGVSSYSFKIRPETAAWSYAMNIQSFDTYDGRVIQLLSCSIESFSVEGYIPPAVESLQTSTNTTIIQANKNYTNIKDPKINALNTSIKNAKEIISKANKEIKALDSEIDKYEKSLKTEKKDAEKKKLEGKIKAAKNRQKELRKQKASANKAIDKYEKQRDKRYSELKRRGDQAVTRTTVSRVGKSSPDIQWRSMKEFERAIKEIMAYHEMGGRNLGSSSNNSYPAHFSFKEVGWDGDVFLTGYSDVRYEPDIPAVKYTLRFEVVNGFDDIKKAVSDQGLENIPDGVGWVRSIYNTPDLGNWEQYKNALGKFVDDAGTHDATKQADFIEYMLSAEGGSNSSDAANSANDKSKKDGQKASGDNDSSFMSGENVLAHVASTVRNTLEKNGLVPQSNGDPKKTTKSSSSKTTKTTNASKKK